MFSGELQLSSTSHLVPFIYSSNLSCLRQVGDVIEVVFRNSLPNAVNLVFNGGLIPDDPSYLTAAISPSQTVRRHDSRHGP